MHRPIFSSLNFKVGTTSIFLLILLLAGRPTPLLATSAANWDYGLQLMVTLNDPGQTGISIEPWLRYHINSYLENYLVSGYSYYSINNESVSQIPFYDYLKLTLLQNDYLQPYLEAGPGGFFTMYPSENTLTFGGIAGGGLTINVSSHLNFDLSAQYRVYDFRHSQDGILFYGLTLGIGI
jgi:hypothetical protein